MSLATKLKELRVSRKQSLQDVADAIGASKTHVWDLETGACLQTLVGHSDAVVDVTVTLDGLVAVSGSRDGTLRVWNLKAATCLRTLELGEGSLMSIAITPDGLRVISAAGSSLKFWDLKSYAG